MKISGATNIGNRRSENQDKYIAGRLLNGISFGFVCDGMGGEAGGEIASRLAAESFTREMVYQCSSRVRDGELFFADPETEITPDNVDAFQTAESDERADKITLPAAAVAAIEITLN